MSKEKTFSFLKNEVKKADEESNHICYPKQLAMNQLILLLLNALL